MPEFYQRNQAGIPAAWVARIRESMGRLAPQYSANRVVRQYSEEHYLPAAAAYAARAEQGGKLGAEILAWQQRLANDWSGISFGPLRVEPKNGALRFEVPVYLGKVGPEDVSVELFADGQNGNGPVRKGMDRGAAVPVDGFVYSASIEGNRPASDFTARVIPRHPSASVPLEAIEILWQR